jgi:ribose/xylose/arabinose/galactoside ABC-type transport system permease subunit
MGTLHLSYRRQRTGRANRRRAGDQDEAAPLGLSGFLCAAGAIIYLYQNISATPGEGADYLLLSFAATILGGVYMYGGDGTIPGVLVGMICLGSITSALTIAGVSPSIYQGVLGVIVLAVVLVQARIRK